MSQDAKSRAKKSARMPRLPKVDSYPSTKEGEVIIEVLQCADCNRLAVSIADAESGVRITNHKCSGRWSVVGAMRADALRIIDAVTKKSKGAQT